MTQHTVAIPIVPKQASINPLVLPKIRALVDGLHSQEIIYCHWKSNEHLDASMRADTDLDILFNKEQKASLLRLLADLGFRQFVAVREKIYRDIEDFIGLDDQSGKIIHVHAHFSMTLGEPYLKSYLWPVEAQLFGNRLLDPVFNIYRTNPADEKILLYVRHALKLRWREQLKLRLKKNGGGPKSAAIENNWLKARTSPDSIKEACQRLFNDEEFTPIISGPLNYSNLALLKQKLRPVFASFRMYSAMLARLMRWKRELTIKLSRRLAKRSDRPILQKRVAVGGSITVALVGADGSGKSTVFQDLQKTFSKKIDLYPIYFGSGNFVSRTKRLYRFCRTGSIQKAKRSSNRSQSGTNDRQLSTKHSVKFWVEAFDAFELALHKRKQFKRMLSAQKKCMLVVCDRFPQVQFMSFNDGPRLSQHRNAANLLLRFLSRKEYTVYSAIAARSPDLIIKLIADASIVEARKPGQTPLAVLEKKIDAVRKVSFARHTKVVEINAADPLVDVLRHVKSTIWSSIK